jgi:hypothetical protein
MNSINLEILQKRRLVADRDTHYVEEHIGIVFLSEIIENHEYTLTVFECPGDYGPDSKVQRIFDLGLASSAFELAVERLRDKGYNLLPEGGHIDIPEFIFDHVFKQSKTVASKQPQVEAEHRRMRS